MVILDTIDKNILKLLQKEPLHPSEISRRLTILRTKIQYRLNRLSKYGYLKKEIQGKKSIWHLIYNHKHNKSFYTTYKDRDILEVYHQLLSLPVDSIVYSIQGFSAAQEELKYIPDSFIKQTHKIFKKKKIIMKGIINEKCLKHFDALHRDMIMSHINRPQGLKILRGDMFMGAGEIISTKKTLFFINPQTKHALMIKDPALVQIVYEMTKLLFELFDQSTLFDLNDYLRRKYTL